VGVILTEMLTGQHPLAPGRRAMPVAGSDVAWRCIQNDPDDRYRSAHDLLAALERAKTSDGGGESSAPSTPSPNAHWWWEFHQAVASIVYAVMVWPTWLAKNLIGGPQGNAIFVTVLAAAIVAVTLRLHLWFTSRFYPAELEWARARAAAWTFASNVLFVIGLAVAGMLVGDARPVLAVIEISVAVGAAAAFAVVEPATTKAAFGRPRRL